jgi:hypothetical protein
MYFNQYDDIYAKKFYVRELPRVSISLPRYVLGYFIDHTWVSVAYFYHRHNAHLIFLAIEQTTLVQDAENFPNNLYANDIMIIPPDYDTDNVIY